MPRDATYTTAVILKRLWGYVRPHWRLLVLGVLMVPVLMGLELAGPMVLKGIVDDHLAPGNTDGLALMVGVFVLLILGRSVVELVQTLVFLTLGQRSARDLRVGLYRHFIRQRAAFFDRVPTGQVVSRLTSDVDDISETVSSGFFLIAIDALRLVAILAFMFALDAALALACAASAVVLAVPISFMRKWMRNASRDERRAVGRLTETLSEYIAGMRVVQVFRRERYANQVFQGHSQRLRDAAISAIRSEVWLSGLIESSATVGTAIVVFYASGVETAAISVGLVVAFIDFINKTQAPILRMTQRLGEAQSALASAERVLESLDDDQVDAPVSTELAAAAPREEALIRFDDVTFGYRDNEPVLKGVSFEVTAGESIAIVGPTGSGKSSVVKLLTRLYEPTGGSIRCFGRDVRGITPKELRKRITVVSQDSFLFSGTIEANVSLAAEGVGKHHVHEALRRVGADQALARKEASADEDVAERGANFSAGEKQMITFARALVRDPEVLVLDEATAHVDPEAEKVIERGLEELMAGRTSIIIAHRLATVRRVNRILVISEGRVVESGSRTELLARGGLYAELERSMGE